ncbi:MAG: TIGR01212 family radical SAM protein [Bacteroidales bacterium]
MSSSNSISKSAFPWGHDRRFNAYSSWFTAHYGGRLQKVSIDAGFTCPNRDGSKGTGGCTFCNNDTFNPSYCHPANSVSSQLQKGITFLTKRYPRTTGFLAYFQAYSNTYSDISRLRALYGEALEFPGIKGLIIGTRPDCIDDEKLEYFRELSGKYYIAVEYGVESCFDRTLARVNRGHDFSEAVRAIEKTASAGVYTGAHFILGLPGESIDDMLKYAEIISRLPVHTVKFHQLQIIKGTRMEAEYLEKPDDFVIFGFEEYTRFIIKLLENLNPAIVVERLSGEAPPGMIAGPGWNGIRGDQVTRRIEEKMKELDTWQGRLYK